jgi:hypothetical protein
MFQNQARIVLLRLTVTHNLRSEIALQGLQGDVMLANPE